MMQKSLNYLNRLRRVWSFYVCYCYAVCRRPREVTVFSSINWIKALQSGSMTRNQTLGLSLAAKQLLCFAQPMLH